MQTKLYSEILEKINSFGEVICKDENGKDCEVIDDFKYPELVQSIEQLLLNKMQDFSNFLLQNTVMVGSFNQMKETDKLKPFTWVEGENKDQIVYNKPIEELIQIYSNK
jgi:hypothetical protein